MRLTQRLANAIRGTSFTRPKPGQVLSRRKEDSIRDYVSVGLTPSRLAAVLREADDGSLSAAMQLFEEMEEKDPHLFSVANTRRLALTGLDWRIISAADVREGVNRDQADRAADYCREVLADIDSFDEALQHLSLALGRNISIVEIVWGSAKGELRPLDLVPIEFTRVVFDELDQPHVLTEGSPDDGIPLAPHKFVTHTPHMVSGHPQRGGLLRVTAISYLAKNLSLKEWMVYTEVFGMPVRIARYEPNATSEEKKEMLRMLEDLGSNATGIFSRAVDLQIIQANRGTAGPPYQSFIEYLNREISKAWLGQTLTTDIVGLSGSVAASRVHETVRQDILADDIRKEGRTIRRDLLTPLARFKFGPDAPVPYFRRMLKQSSTAQELADVLDVAVNQLGLRVPAAWTRDALGIPEANEQEATLGGARD